jgi:hypothetical protein
MRATRYQECAMPMFAFVAPILARKEQLDLETFEQFTAVDEREAYVAARRAAGVTREAVWHQRTPDGGTLAIVLLEAHDVEAAFGHIVTSDAPFDRRFRAVMQEVHGFDLASAPPPDVRLICDTRF